MLLTLKEWASDVYQDPPPIGTLQRWARNVNIYPPPEKHWREYKVQHDAFYIKPNKACSKIQHQNPNGRTGKKAAYWRGLNMSRKYNRDLPRNLTYRKKYKKYYWRNPVSGKEFPLDGLSKSQAIAQAIVANNYITNNFTPSGLLQRITDEKQLTMGDWLERYSVILQRRELAAKTYKVRAGQIATINEKMGELILNKVNTRHIADFLDTWIAEGKKTMAATMRSVLIDIFREAIAEGALTLNPVEPTRTPKIVVFRQRLSLEIYGPIRAAADTLSPWLPLAMDLALVTAQRREDIANMRFTDVYDDRLHVTQIKTGAMIAIPLSLSLNGIRLSAIIDRCRLLSTTDFLISAGKRKNSPDGAIHLDSLTKGFVKARKLSGLEFSAPPLSMRSEAYLVARMKRVGARILSRNCSVIHPKK